MAENQGRGQGSARKDRRYQAVQALGAVQLRAGLSCFGPGRYGGDAAAPGQKAGRPDSSLYLE
jgi:hypothetical protein